MPTSLSRVLSFLALSLCLAALLADAARAAEDDPAIASLEQESGGSVSVTRSKRSGLVTFLAIKNGAPAGVAGKAANGVEGLAAPAVDAEANARAFVSRYGRLFGLREAGQARTMRTSPRDEVGMDHVRFQQIEQGVPVTGAEFIVHLKDGRVTAMGGRALRLPAGFNLNPAAGPERALQAARQLLEKRLKIDNATFTTPRLEVFDLALLGGPPRPTRLAWFIEATRIDVRQFIWVDAQTGGVLKHFSQLADALNRKIYNGNHGPTLPGTLVRSEGGAATGDPDADLAYTYSGDVWNYYKNKHNRDSFDGAGGQLKSTVHSCPQGCPYENASWNGSQMVYGDGYSQGDDVDAHELTHAVTQYTAGLFYYMQSGALNESFSDIFGETVDLTNGKGNDTAGVRWEIGEDVPGVGALRNMMDPTIFGNAGKVSDAEYVCPDQPLDPVGDAGGVHQNSGVPNHAYALMADGGTYNGFTVAGVGLDKAGAIQYRALSEYLSSASDFRDDYDAVVQSCYDLVGGSDGIAESDCLEVQKALDAVEMTAAQPCAPAQANIPDQCSVGTAPLFAFADNLEKTTSGNWKTTFVQPGSVWVDNPFSNGVGSPKIYHPDFAKSGLYSFWGFDFDVITHSTVDMSKSVQIPPSAFLYFNHSYGFDHDPDGTYDGGLVQYSPNNGANWFPIPAAAIVGGAGYGQISPFYDNPLAGNPAFVGESWGYTASKIDLSPLAGQNVRFGFRMATDSIVADYGWFIDDVRIYSCDVGGTVKLSSAIYSVSETGPTVTITVTRTGGAVGDVSVDYTTSSGTATDGVDYQSRSGTLVFPQGTSGAAVSQTITIPITNDTIFEGNETFNFTLSNATGASLALGTPSTAVVTINDNDVAGGLQFGAATSTVGEGSTNATITVKRTGGSASGVSVHYATSNGSATAGSDYTAASGTLTFGANVMSQTFQVPITNDTLDENDELLNLTLSAPGGGGTLGSPSAATLKITDNDTAGQIQFSASSYSASEGSGGMMITVSRANGSAGNVTVHYSTADGTATSADYTTSSGMLTFDAGVMTRTFFVPFTADSVGENNETVLLHLSSPTGGATLGGRANAVLTINEDETVMQFSAPQYTIGEATSKLTVTVKRNGNVAPASSVEYALVDGSAVAGSDYAVATGTIAFTAGSTSRTFTVTILNDTISENPEFFALQLQNPVGGVLGPQSTSTVLVNDDDSVLAFGAATYKGSEGGGDVVITVKRSGTKSTPASVQYDTVSAGATDGVDTPGAHGVLNFAANATQATFKVPITNDTDAEGPETLDLVLTNPTGARLGLSTAVLTITDNEPVLGFGAATYTVAENKPSVTITVKRTGPGNVPVSVHWAATDGTATDGSDYTAATGVLNFAAGVNQLSFPVTILPDTVGEGPETVNLALNTSTGASLGVAGAVLTITDDDPSISFGSAKYSGGEGTKVTVTVKRTGPLTAPASVLYATSDGSATEGADYTATSGVASFGVGKGSVTFSVPLLQDLEDEPAETVLLTLSTPTGGTIGLGAATLTINDDDQATTVKLGSTSYSGSETDGVALVSVLRSGNTGTPVTVHYFTADLTAQAGTDYLGVADSVTLAPGETQKVIAIPLFSNGPDSPAKAFTVTLDDLTDGATHVEPSSTTVFITP